MNLTRNYFELALIKHKSLHRIDALLALGKFLSPEDFVNLINLPLEFLSVANKLGYFKSSIRSISLKDNHLFSSRNGKVLLIKLPIFDTLTE
jgi:hypothetical protein